MTKLIHKTAVVQEGGRIELQSDELVEGEAVSITLEITTEPDAPRVRRLTDIIGAGTGVFKTAEEVDAYIRELRD